MIANAILDAATIVAISYALSRPLRGGLGDGRNDFIRFGQRLSVELRQYIARIQHAFLPVAGFFVREPVVHGRQQGVVAAMGGGSVVRARLVPLHGLGRADACRRDRPAFAADGLRPERGQAGMARDRRPRGRDWSPGERHSSCAVIGRLPGAFGETVPVGRGSNWRVGPPIPILPCSWRLPSVLFCIRTIADRPALSDPRWFNVAAFGWILTQFFAFAAGRALIPVENRYFDTLLIGLAVNMTSFFWLVESNAWAGKRRIWWSAALAAWLVIVAGVAGPSDAPAAWLDGMAPRDRGGPGEQRALLSRHRRRVLSRPRSAVRDPLPRCGPVAPIARCARNSRRPCRLSFSRGIHRRIGSRRSRGPSSPKAIHGSARAFSCFSLWLPGKRCARRSAVGGLRLSKPIRDFRKAGRAPPSDP